ncbi:MAG: helix-turn-helix domain-containing protein [Tabrizicola flagellatus]|uniref:helix-turn-helix domain-containing protein n=1 Tax=Tabrizicola flagellatus TaxID=2593021 RepID=UPI00391A6C41
MGPALLGVLHAGHTAPKLSIDKVISAYAKVTGLSLSELVGPSQAHAITAYRHELMYIIRKLDPAASFTLIGRFMGGRDMSTVHEAVAKVDQRLAREPGYAAELASLCRQIVDLAQEAAVSGPQAKPWQLLAACSVLRDAQMTDADARKAALGFLQQLEAAHG